MDPAAVAVDVGTDRAAVEAQHRLVRQDQRHRIVIRWSTAGRACLLAEARHHQIDADRNRRARARAERRRPPGIVGIGRISAPGAALITQCRGQHLRRLVAAARITGAAIVFGVDRLGENDRAFVAELPDQDMIARREIDVVAGVPSPGRPHVLGVERILEREDDPVHGHLHQVGILPVSGIELGRVFESIRQMPKILAHRGRIRRQRSKRRMPVKVAAASGGALPANVEGGERIHLPGIGDADDHAELLLDLGIGWRSAPCDRIRAAAPGICRDRAEWRRP